MITVSYHGVHQSYQLALAAEEAGVLSCFFCSFFDAPGKWGRRLSRLLGPEVLRNRRIEGIPDEKIIEHPWPELFFKARQRIQKLPSNAWIAVAQDFDRWAARQLKMGNHRLLVAAENCAWQSFHEAGRLGMGKIYDCPGINAEQLQETTHEAARRTGLPFVSVADTPEITRRKEEEIGMADVVLTYSEFHADGVAVRGVPRENIRIVPLWTDPEFWSPVEEQRARRNSPLRLLFAGGINLRKGVPFLIEAARRLAPAIHLTLVGSLDPDAKACLAGVEDFVTVLPPVTKERLREIYRNHDVLVLPSLGDSFGFVAMEAMACGLPVILTTHCGVPVPDPSWRVPVMDAGAIAERIRYYLDQRERVAADGARAREFAAAYTPERYRRNIGAIFREILTGKKQKSCTSKAAAL